MSTHLPTPSGAPAYCFRDESTARAYIIQEWPNLVPIGRMAGDDPVIIGVWT